MDEQRASLPRLPGLNNANPDILRRLSSEPAGEDAAALPDENFFEMLMRCQVRSSPAFLLYDKWFQGQLIASLFSREHNLLHSSRPRGSLLFPPLPSSSRSE